MWLATNPPPRNGEVAVAVTNSQSSKAAIEGEKYDDLMHHLDFTRARAHSNEISTVHATVLSGQEIGEPDVRERQRRPQV
jgi:hypothetical protein